MQNVGVAKTVTHRVSVDVVATGGNEKSFGRTLPSHGGGGGQGCWPALPQVGTSGQSEARLAAGRRMLWLEAGQWGAPVVGQCPPSVVLFKLPRTYRCAVIRRMTNVWPSNTTVWTLPVARSARLSDIPIAKADHLFSATIPGSYDLSDPGLDIEIWRRRAKRCGYLSAIGRLPVGNHIDRSGHQIRICAPARRQPQGDGVEAIVEPRQDVMLVVRDLGLAGQWLAAAERSKGEQQQPRPSGGRGGQLLAHC